MDVALSLAFGTIVGFALGLTGGGGSIFAVPLLVYGLAINPHEAIGVSLAAVGATAAVGFVHRVLRREVELGTGLIFAATGMVGAPIGSWINSSIPAPVLLTLFAGLMFVIAVRMWRQASRTPGDTTVVRAAFDERAVDEPGPSCRRDPEGKLHLTSRCAGVLAGLGLITGVLSGLFGVGGGFVIVPALVLFSGMGIHRAVATSLMVIALISSSGVASYVVSGREFSLTIAGLFVLGGVGGLLIGTQLGRRLSGPKLQKVFSAAIVLVAAFIVTRNWG